MWRDAAWLYDMPESGRMVLEYVAGIDRHQFLESTFHQDAVIRRLMIIGKAAKHISPEMRAAHPEVAWWDIAAFRDVLVHQYSRVDLELVWQIVQTDVSKMVVLLEPLVSALESEDEER